MDASSPNVWGEPSRHYDGSLAVAMRDLAPTAETEPGSKRKFSPDRSEGAALLAEHS
jgi:hypothetical protein